MALNAAPPDSMRPLLVVMTDGEPNAELIRSPDRDARTTDAWLNPQTPHDATSRHTYTVTRTNRKAAVIPPKRKNPYSRTRSIMLASPRSQATRRTVVYPADSSRARPTPSREPCSSNGGHNRRLVRTALSQLRAFRGVPGAARHRAQLHRCRAAGAFAFASPATSEYVPRSGIALYRVVVGIGLPCRSVS
jgi:hypothetical protein